MKTEDNFTTHKTELCPHPEYWHAPNDIATEYEVSLFIQGLVRLIQPEYVVETGTFQGHTAAKIGLALFFNGHGELDTLDNGDDATHELAVTATSLFSSYVNLVRIHSLSFIARMPIDLAFFDSSTGDRVREFRYFYEGGFLKQHAIVVFHDAAPHHEVRESIKPLEEEGLVKFLWFNTPRGLAVGQVQ
jgi:predicted O-methyltransferase YrrM